MPGPCISYVVLMNISNGSNNTRHHDELKMKHILLVILYVCYEGHYICINLVMIDT